MSTVEITSPTPDREVIQRAHRLVKNTRAAAKEFGIGDATVSFPCDVAERIISLAEKGLPQRP